MFETTCPNKITAILAIPLAFLLGGTTIYLEKIGYWGQMYSLLYFAFLVPVIFGISYMLWPFTVFQLKRPEA